jgi:SWI/SNF-related matrix-associated actin-dependent regulator of chromatin subfamily A3
VLSHHSFGAAIAGTDLYQVEMVFEEQCFFLLSSTLERLAVLNEETSGTLQSIIDLPDYYFKAYILVEHWSDLVERGTNPNRAMYISVDVVLYGLEEIRDTVGKLLSTARAYLQHPCYQESGTFYDNPHFLKLTDLLHPSQPAGPALPKIHLPQINPVLLPATETSADRDSESAQVRRKIATVFNTLTRSKHLKRLEADIRINTPLLA